MLSLGPRQSRLDDLVGHARLLPGDEVVRRKSGAQGLLVDVVDQEIRGEALLLQLDEIGEQLRRSDRRRGGAAAADAAAGLALPIQAFCSPASLNRLA